MKKVITSCFLIVLLVTQVACTTTELTTTLNAVADAASVAAIAGAFAPAPYGALISTYAGQVSTITVEASTELSSGDTNAIKIQKIVADFASIAVPQIPGAPANLQATIGAITIAIETFVGQLKSALASPLIAGPASFPKHLTKYKLSMGDKRAIAKAKAKAKATLVYIEAHKK